MKYCLILLLLFSILGLTLSQQINVNPSSSCDADECRFLPYSNLFKAIRMAYKNNDPLQTLILYPGVYKGILNKNLDLKNINLQFGTNNVNSQVIIDCEGIGNAFNIFEESFITFSGIQFQNCSKSRGSVMSISDSVVHLERVAVRNSKSEVGSIFLSNSKLFVDSSNFTSNKAMLLGASIYATGSSEIDVDEKSLFIDNLIHPAKKLDVTLQDQSIMNIKSSSVFTSCSSDSNVFDQNSNSICKFDQSSTDGSTTPNVDPTEMPLPEYCGDLICDPINEDYFSCPSDCNSTYFNGFLKTEQFIDPQSLQLSHIKSPLLHNIFTPFNGRDGPLKGNLTAFFKIAYDTKVYFRLNFTNIGVKVKIGNMSIIDFQSLEENQYYTNKVVEGHRYLVSEEIHTFTVEYLTTLKHSQGPRSMSVEYSLFNNENYQPFDISYYSENNCGDGIYQNEDTCLIDLYKALGPKVVLTNGTCGNGLCDERDPHMCLVDCYKYMTQKCSPLTSKKGSIVPQTYSNQDTLGLMIANQVVWRLPGYQHLSFGMNQVFGTQSESPLFYFGFCQDKETNVVEDVYRQAFYEVPKELSVVPLPKCSFTIDNQFWSSAKEMKRSQFDKSRSSTSASVGGGYGVVSGEVEASFSQEKSVKTASKVSSERKGSLIESNIMCSISQVTLNEHVFSPNFLQDISKAETIREYISLIQKYGTHYYSSATLGGNLRQITVTSESTDSTERKNSVSKKVAKEMSAKVSSPVFGVSGSYSDSKDADTNEESMSEFRKKTSKTNLLIYGGQPGAYSPSYSDTNLFGNWADSIDQLPIPIKYKLEPIRAIIPNTWRTPSGNISVVQQWTDAEELYYELMLQNPNSLGDFALKDKSTMLWFSGFRRNTGVTPQLMVQNFRVQGDPNTITSQVDFKTMPLSWGRYLEWSRGTMFDYYIFTTPFKVNWDPASGEYIRLLSSQENTATQREGMVGVRNEPISELRVKNVVFMMTQKTINFPRRFLFEVWGSDKSKYNNNKNYNVWAQYDIAPNGDLYVGTVKHFYFLIPPIPMSYSKLAINVHIGPLVQVIYISGYCDANKANLITLPVHQARMIACATSIDYTPEYPRVAALSSDYNWYYDGAPNSGAYWHFTHPRTLSKMNKEMVNVWGPYWAVTDKKGNMWVHPYSGDKKVEHISSVFYPVTHSSYLFLPNTKDNNYLPFSIPPSSFNFQYNDLENYAVSRMSDPGTAKHINYPLNSLWYRDLEFPAEEYYPFNLPHI
eukprot:gene9062-11100_t